MEITDEIKAKVFAQYIGQKVKLPDFTIEKFNGVFYDKENWWFSFTHEAKYNLLIKYCMPILKPISDITDEDAIGVAKMFGVTKKIKRHKSKNCYIMVHRGYDSISFIENDVTYEDGVSVEGDVSRRLDVYQYLQSKGYDLPQYLLGNKTLHECGLAIYESEK
jgi:hypothetical protein